MKTLSTILSAAVMLQMSVCTTFAAAADTTTSNIDSQPVEVSMAGCGTKRRHHAARQVRTQTKSYSATSTETMPPQTINVPIKTQCATPCPTACPTVITQPACAQQEVIQPAIVERHRNILPYLIVGGLLIATAIAVPLAVTHHHHRRNDVALRQQQLLLLQRATP
jgi:hypothetical protein